MTFAIKVNKLYKKFKIKHYAERTLFYSLKNVFSKKDISEEFYSLKNINLEINKGDIIGVIGANGAGKTTLLQIIARIMEPTKGRIITNGKILPIIDLGSSINPELTGKENIFLSGTVIGLSRKQIRKKYSEIVNFSGLGKFIDVKTKYYSSGMKLRLEFSIYLLTNADILLLDEVFGVGDIKFQKKCLQKMQNFVNEGKTFFLVSQSTDLLKNFCDKVMLLDKGRIVYFGDPYIATKKYALAGVSCLESHYNDFGTKEIEIVSVKLLNLKREETTSFNKGDKMIVEMSYVNHKNIKNPMFGLAIFSNNILLIGPNTTEANVLPKNLKKRGVVSFEIEQIPFTTTKCSLTVAVHNYRGDILYHRKERCKLFNIKQNNKNYPFFKTKYNWSFR